MSSDDEVIIISETFNTKRARTSVPTPFNSCGGAAQEVAVTASGAAVTASGEFAFESLQCAICIDLLYDPCVVPCGHEFCRTCIEEVVRSSRHRGCPICRATFTASRLGVNRKLKTLIEHLFAKESSRRAREVAEDQERIHKEKAAAARDTAASAHATLVARLESMASAHGAHRSSSYDRLTHMVDGMVDGLHALRGEASEALLGDRAQRGEGGRRGVLSRRGLSSEAIMVEAMLRSRRLRSSDRLTRPAGPGGEAGGEAGAGAAAAPPGVPASGFAALLAERAERLRAHAQPSPITSDVQQQLRNHMQRMRELSQEATRLNQLRVQLGSRSAAAAAGNGDPPPSARPAQPPATATPSQPPSLHLLAPLRFSLRPLPAAAGPSAAAAAQAQPQSQPQASELADSWLAASGQGTLMQDQSALHSDYMAWMSGGAPSRRIAPRRIVPRGRVAEGPFADSSGGPADALAAEHGGPALGSEEQEVMSARIAVVAAGALLDAAATADGPAAGGGRGGGARRSSRRSSLDNDHKPMPGYGWDDFGIPPWLEPPPPLPITRTNAFTERMLPALAPRLPRDESWRTSRLVFPDGPDPRDRIGLARRSSVPDASRPAGAAREQQPDEQPGVASFLPRTGPSRARAATGVRTELVAVGPMVAAADMELDSDPGTPELPVDDLLPEGMGFGEFFASVAADAEADSWLGVTAAPAHAGGEDEAWPEAAAGVAAQERVRHAQEEEQRRAVQARGQHVQQREQQVMRLESAGAQMRERVERYRLHTRQQQQQQQQQ